MTWTLPPLRPTYKAALRDIRAATPQARQAAAERLSEPDTNTENLAVKALLVLLSDNHPNIRREAIRSLGKLREESTLPNLIQGLTDDCAIVREEAVVAIANFDTLEVNNKLAQALGSSYPEVRFQAVLHLGNRICEEYIGQILPLMKDDHPKVRAATAYVLGLMDYKGAIEALGNALSDEEWEVQLEASLALAKFGDSRAIPILRKALFKQDSVFDVLSALIDLKDYPAVDRIAELTRGLFGSQIIKAAAARALILLGDKRGIEALRSVMTSWRWEGRSYAVEIVGELGIIELAKELRQLAEHLHRIDPQVLVHSLIELSPASDEAVQGLKILSSYASEIGEKARAELLRLNSVATYTEPTMI